MAGQLLLARLESKGNLCCMLPRPRDTPSSVYASARDRSCPLSWLLSIMDLHIEQAGLPAFEKGGCMALRDARNAIRRKLRDGPGSQVKDMNAFGTPFVGYI
jgi:hypothetical protein